MSHTITTQTYQDLKNYYDENLNKDDSLVKTSNDVPTPIDCVEEMINTIPENFWKNPSIKIFDPCCGCGNFFLTIYFKLLKYHSAEHIISNMLYFNDLNTDRLNVVKLIFGIRSNVTEKDFLVFDEDIKFDLIVANPPYAKLLPNGKRASKNHNMIGSFINKSLKILKEKGYLLYITPDNWMSFADRNTLIKTLTSLQIIHINIHSAKKKYFKKVGSSFTWYLIENIPSYKDIVVEGIWKNKEYKSTVKSEERRFIPLFYNKLIQSIINKTIDKANDKFEVLTSSDLHKYTKKKLISKDKDEEHKYKLIHTPSQTVYANRPHKFQDGYKVFISTTTYYSTFVDNCGMTQSIAFVRCKNKKQAEKIQKILMHPMYKFINNICRYGNFNNIRILQNFPKCMNYKKVYETFDITKEEQEFIEKNL
ncbi:N-6 DNA methylase [Flavobacteriaceae bacterium]|nr:N-6 DNA methylase [Flavobacteriaceae bacterium]